METALVLPLPKAIIASTSPGKSVPKVEGTLWRYEAPAEGSPCKCCPSPPPPQSGVVVKRRRPSLAVKESSQSPIDISEASTDHLPMASCPNAVKIGMGVGEATLDYNGHGFQVVWSAGDQNMLTIDDKVFRGIQFHFHTPSEHTLDSIHEELEVHFVHKADDGTIAVLGVLFRAGKHNAFLGQFWDKLDLLEHGVATKIPVGTINPQDLNILSSTFFRYRGSLTTPPYTEGVEWIVIHDVMEASREQLDAFHRALPGTNAREVQPLNNRHVLFEC